MGDTKRTDFFGIDNDSSASSFGWNFQSNAAIFLAFNYCMDGLKDIKVESSFQDIDITMNNNHKILAQAKSTTDYSKYRKDKQRVYDAFTSLAVSQAKYNDGTFIYITNIPGFFDDEYDLFLNKVYKYENLPESIKIQIDNLFKEMMASVNKCIVKASSEKQKVKYMFELECLKKFEFSKMAFCVVGSFIGNDESNRYSNVLKAIEEFLSNNLKLGDAMVSRIKKRILEFMQNKFQHNSTIKDDENIFVSMKRKEIMWPIVAFVVDVEQEIDEKIKRICTFHVDQSFINEFEDKKSKIDLIRYEKFEFTSKILFDYGEYLKEQDISSDYEIDFVKCYYKYYLKEFEIYGFDKDMTEFMTKWFIYLIVLKNKQVATIVRALGESRYAN